MAACVRVPSHQDAQYAISQLHRKKIGFKRILISHSHGQTHNPLVLRYPWFLLILRHIFFEAPLNSRSADRT